MNVLLVSNYQNRIALMELPDISRIAFCVVHHNVARNWSGCLMSLATAAGELSVQASNP
jgi:hypothetical protein